MATVTNNMTRINTVDSTDSFTTGNIPTGGPAPGANTDIFLQGDQSMGKRITTTGATPSGWGLIDGADNDCSASGTHVGMWIWVTHYAILQALRVSLGSGTTPSSNYDYWPMTVADYPALGGWVRVWVDVTTGTTGAGTYTPSQTRHYGVQASFTTTPGGTSPNLLHDSADYVTGAALTLTGTSGVWQDFATADETTSNQYGVFRTVGGVRNCWARVQLGSSGTSLVFNDSGFALVFVDQEHVAATWMGISIDLQNASTNIDWFNGVVRSAGTILGDLVVTGTSGAFDASAMTLANLRIITLTSACSLTASSIAGCGLITAAGADLSNTAVSGYEGAADSSALLWNVVTSPAALLGGMSFTKGTAATHAIEFGASAPQTFTLSNITFTGYNAANGNNDSTLYFADTGSDVTWNVTIDGGTTPSYKKARAGDTVNIITGSVTVTLTGLKTGSEVRVYDQGTGAEIDGVESSGTSFAFSDTASNVVDIRIFHLSYLPADIEGFTIPGSNTSIPVQQVFDRNYANP